MVYIKLTYKTQARKRVSIRNFFPKDYINLEVVIFLRTRSHSRSFLRLSSPPLILLACQLPTGLMSLTAGIPLVRSNGSLRMKNTLSLMWRLSSECSNWELERFVFVQDHARQQQWEQNFGLWTCHVLLLQSSITKWVGTIKCWVYTKLGNGVIIWAQLVIPAFLGLVV